MPTANDGDLPLDLGGKPVNIPQHANPTSNPNAPTYRRGVGNRVAYGQTELGKHVAGMRKVQSSPPPPSLRPTINKNLAAARLSNGDIIDGESGGDFGCSENEIQAKLDLKNKDRSSDDQLTIDELYTEREPCCKCENLMKTKHPDADIEWSVEYFDNPNKQSMPPEAVRTIRALNKFELGELKRISFTYHGIL